MQRLTRRRLRFPLTPDGSPSPGVKSSRASRSSKACHDDRGTLGHYRVLAKLGEGGPASVRGRATRDPQGTAGRTVMTFSIIVRRTHMYLALFLFPWILMYALSTLAMNHRAVFSRDGGAPCRSKGAGARLRRDVPGDAELRTISNRSCLGRPRRRAQRQPAKDGTIVITRNDLSPTAPYLLPRPTARCSSRGCNIARTALLERFHRRRGYATGYVLDTVWAVSVDWSSSPWCSGCSRARGCGGR